MNILHTFLHIRSFMKFALLGKNIAHSLSPQIHHALFQKYGVNASYELINTHSPQIVLPLLTKGELQGVNVTIPYKQSFFDYVLSPIAKQMGACNILYVQNGQLCADNTDGFGFQIAMEFARIPQVKTALILGTGGVAKAIAYMLQKQNIQVQFVSRSKKGKEYIAYEDVINHRADLLVNASPLGMPPYQDSLPLPPETLLQFPYIMDTAYHLTSTVLQSFCKQHQIPCASGLVMLIAQAIQSQCIWFGRPYIDEDIYYVLQQLGVNYENISYEWP